MASSGSTKDALDALVIKFVEDCAEINCPVFLIATAYENAAGEPFYRTRVDGQSDAIIAAFCALMSILTPEDFGRLEIEMKMHPGFAMFRAANRTPSSKLVN